MPIYLLTFKDHTVEAAVFYVLERCRELKQNG